MNIKDFFFSYKTIIKSQIKKKKFFKALSKLFNFPYKFLIFKIKILLNLDKINADKLIELDTDNLDQLFVYFNTDKGSEVKIIDKIQKGHNYSSHYEKYFAKFKNNGLIKILEIGSLFGAGTASFLKYFDQTKIISLDINPFNMKYYSKKIRPIFIDTQLPEIITDLANYIKEDFDIIIDDGSHNKRDQILVLNYFFPKLKNQGIYVIEDSTQYLQIPSLNHDKLDYGINEFLDSVKKNGDHESQYLNIVEKKKLQSNIKNIFFEKGNFFYKNQSLPEIIFIEKI
jgi:predicted O-methyltransferase YrrM